MTIEFTTICTKLGIKPADVDVAGLITKVNDTLASVHETLEIDTAFIPCGEKDIFGAMEYLAYSPYFEIPEREPTLSAALDGRALQPFLEHFFKRNKIGYNNFYDDIRNVEILATEVHRAIPQELTAYVAPVLRGIIVAGIAFSAVGGFASKPLMTPERCPTPALIHPRHRQKPVA